MRVKPFGWSAMSDRAATLRQGDEPEGGATMAGGASLAQQEAYAWTTLLPGGLVHAAHVAGIRDLISVEHEEMLDRGCAFRVAVDETLVEHLSCDGSHDLRGAVWQAASERYRADLLPLQPHLPALVSAELALRMAAVAELIGAYRHFGDRALFAVLKKAGMDDPHVVARRWTKRKPCVVHVRGGNAWVSTYVDQSWAVVYETSADLTDDARDDACAWAQAHLDSHAFFWRGLDEFGTWRTLVPGYVYNALLSSHAEVEQTVSALRDPDRPDIRWLALDLTKLPTVEDVVEGMEALRPTYDDHPFPRCAATAKAMRSREEQEIVTGNHNRLRLPGTVKSQEVV